MLQKLLSLKDGVEPDNDELTVPHKMCCWMLSSDRYLLSLLSEIIDTSVDVFTQHFENKLHFIALFLSA